MKYWIKLFIVLIVFTGCGPRKVNKSSVEIKQQTTSTIKDSISQVSEKIESLIDTTSTIEETYEPINDSLPFTVNGKQYKNVRVTKKKTKNGITSTKKEESVLNQTKTTNNKTITEIKEDTKDIKKEPVFNLWWLLVIVAIITYIDYNRE